LNANHLPVCVTQLDEPELGSRVNDQVFSHLAHVNHEETGPLQELHDKVSIGHDVHRVFSYGLEAEFGSQELPIESVGIPGQSSASERQDRNAGDDSVETVQVCQETVGIGQEEMRPTDGLGSLFSGDRFRLSAQYQNRGVGLNDRT
jgi:hypothetical protein